MPKLKSITRTGVQYRVREYKREYKDGQRFSLRDEFTFRPEDTNALGLTLPSCTSGSRQRCGTEPRYFHWWRVFAEMPSIFAPSCISPQSISSRAMTSNSTYNLLAEQEQIGSRQTATGSLQIVSMTKIRTNLSYPSHNPQDTETPSNLEKEFDRRASAMIAGYQDAHGLSNPDMVVFFEDRINLGNYVSYKIRGKFPAHVIWFFCMKTGIALDGVPIHGEAKRQAQLEKRHRLHAEIEREVHEIAKRLKELQKITR